MTSIKFACQCGQHLKARPDSAGRLTMCPRCRAPVAVPRLQANHRGVDELPTSLSGSRPRPKAVPARPSAAVSKRSRSTSVPASATQAVEPVRAPARSKPEQPATPPRRRQRSKRRRHPESDAERIRLRSRPRWKQLCTLSSRWSGGGALEFSLGSFPAVLGAAAGLAAAGGASLLLLPGLVASDPAAWLPFTLPLLLASLSAAYACLFLTRTLSGELDANAKRGRAFQLGSLRAVRSLVLWAGCLLAGPLPLAVLGAWYWIYCGELDALDYLILAEVAVVGVGYGLFAIVVVCKTGRLRRVTPIRVVDEAIACGWRGLGVMLLACALVASHAALTFHAATMIHNNPFGAFLLMGVCWLSALYLGSFTLRLAGRCSHDRGVNVNAAVECGATA